MQDREPTYPGRVTLTPVYGLANTYDMERADRPLQEGTPLNKASLLKDATAALYGKTAEAVPDDMLSVLSKSVLAQTTGKYTRHVGTNADRPVGSTVTLNVGGKSYEFIVVQQGKPSSLYDDSCNGTWLLMKDCYTQRIYSSNGAEYYNSSIDAWLNDDFINSLDVKDTVKTVKIPYRLKAGSTISGANGLSRKAFLPSYRELGGTKAYSETGAMLEYFSSINSDNNSNLRIAYDHETAGSVSYFTRDPQGDGADLVLVITNSGGKSGVSPGSSHYIRPCIILHSDGEYVYYTDKAGNTYTEQEYETKITDVLGNLIAIPADQIKNGVKIATGSYTGTGTYGSSNPNSLTFSFEPKLVFMFKDKFPVYGSVSSTTSYPVYGTTIGMTTTYSRSLFNIYGRRSGDDYYLYAKKSSDGKTLSWYHEARADDQMNDSGATYRYIAIG